MELLDIKDPKSRIWDLLSFVVVTATGLACLYLLYNTFEVGKDLPTAIAAALAGYVISFVKGLVATE